MRTTLTLDEDIAQALNHERHSRGESFRATVNRILKLGLAAANPQRLEPFRLNPFDLGLREGFSYDHVGELLEELEGPRHR